MNYILTVALILIGITFAVGIKTLKGSMQGKGLKTFLGVNVFSFFGLMIAAAVFMLGGVDAMAATTDTASAVSSDGLKFVAAALSTGLAAIGAGIAVAISGSAAIGAISENEKLLGKTVIFVGLAEGIAIYGLIISIMILGS